MTLYMCTYACPCALLNCVSKTCLTLCNQISQSKRANSQCLYNKILVVAWFTYGKKKKNLKKSRETCSKVHTHVSIYIYLWGCIKYILFNRNVKYLLQKSDQGAIYYQTINLQAGVTYLFNPLCVEIFIFDHSNQQIYKKNMPRHCIFFLISFTQHKITL